MASEQMMTTSGERNSDGMVVQDLDVDVNDLFTVLANPRRRFVIACLDSRSKPMAIADVANELTRWECETSEDHIPEEQVESRHIALYHVHVPKMADVGIIECDVDRKTVALVDAYDGIPMEVLPSVK